MPKIEISEKLILFLEFLPIFFFSLAVHEFAHAYTAYKKGDLTAKALGRMTLNPIKHIDLVGSLLMPFISFFTGSMFIGWAKPVPVNRGNFRNPKKDDITVSIAGPVSNLLMAFLFVLLMVVAIRLSLVNENILRILWLGVTFNVFLFLFNLLPIPPLDGSHVVLNLFPNSIYSRMIASPLIGTIIIFVLIFSPLWRYFIALVDFVLRIFARFVI
jgi:Zn-dependent protease